MGGKSQLLKLLIPLIPPHTTYVEVFGGGAYLLLNKKPSSVEVYNDIDGELVNLFTVVRDKPRAFIRRVVSLPYSRQLYERSRRRILKASGHGTSIDRAVRYYYCLRSAFYGHVEKGWRFALKTSEASRLYNSIGEMEDIARRLKAVYIDHLDFRRCLKNWDSDDTFFFIDPPYFDSTSYRRGLSPFTPADHQDLAALARDLQGKWLLTYNDHPHIRDVYRGFIITPVDTQMATWKGPAGSKRPRFRQLIIRNYKLVTHDAEAETA